MPIATANVIRISTAVRRLLIGLRYVMKVVIYFALTRNTIGSVD